MARVRWSQTGFLPTTAPGETPRNLMGFKDGTRNVMGKDGKWITFFAYRDGGYDIWAVAPDGSHQHKLTWGAFDDREPIWSHDGTRVAFSSDRGSPLGGRHS